MFTENFDLYHLIYSFKDYEKESAEIIQIINSKHSKFKNILDLECGTAEHHKYLKNIFNIDSMDLNPKFIETGIILLHKESRYCLNYNWF